MSWFSGPAIDYLRQYRTLAIEGRVGGYKTSLAFFLASQLLADGLVDGIRSNVAAALARPYVEAEMARRHAIVLDEAGQFLYTSTQARAFVSGVRKIDCYFLFPSVVRVHSDMRIARVSTWADFTQRGLPLVVYRSTLVLPDGMDKGWCFWWRPKSVFGLYSTKVWPTTDGRVKEAVRLGLEKLEAMNNKEWAEWGLPAPPPDTGPRKSGRVRAGSDAQQQLL